MEKLLKILHIEDNEADAGLVKRALKNGSLDFVIKVVETRSEFEAALEDFKPDVILSDHSLPQFNSMEALEVCKSHRCIVPFILITGSVSEEFAVKSIKEGADDYILKNSLIRLPNAIRHAIKSKRTEVDKAKAMQLLQATNNELNTFIYKAAHDLRGPLCSIMGLTNIAAMEKESENLPDYIKKISESTKKLDAVLLSLIEVMSIKDAKPALKEIDFDGLVSNILERFEFTEDFNRINFKLDITNRKGFYSDEHIINSVLQNLIENAIKYHQTNTPDPYVSIHIFNTESGITMEIEDNGSGIDTKIQDQVFDMYFRGNQSSQGSGLGLYIVKNGVEKLGGTIELTSTPKEGTKFTVQLPGDLLLM
jgi:signal transduction histidine kinase